ncbi:uncharacterized protein LOC129590426 isoform X2 [Paramacrobiotus metropolitanus]|uniref:uncharacterized protein LOC129590426 isoform X2 n=1 Tax=Paramacrobiotus metropolitanus TaxID=2943436 RepID=UPI002445B5EA|nr:uncharacterized protein LOC129590426 isoform X2 [Paramacrobiotus metropolitanus]
MRPIIWKTGYVGDVTHEMDQGLLEKLTSEMNVEKIISSKMQKYWAYHEVLVCYAISPPESGPFQESGADAPSRTPEADRQKKESSVNTVERLLSARQALATKYGNFLKYNKYLLLLTRYASSSEDQEGSAEEGLVTGFFEELEDDFSEVPYRRLIELSVHDVLEYCTASGNSRTAVLQQGPGFDLLIALLENNGAPNCAQYVRKYLTHDECFFLHTFHSTERGFLAEAVNTLPRVCRQTPAKDVFCGLQGRTELAAKSSSIKSASGNFVDNVLCYIAGFGSTKRLSSRAIDDTPENERENARNQIRKCTDHILKRHSRPDSVQLEVAVSIITEAAGKNKNEKRTQKLTKDQLDRIIQSIEPYIYGDNTPMCAALLAAYSILKGKGNSSEKNAPFRQRRGLIDRVFSSRNNNSFGAERKMLFLMTDGYTTDGTIPIVPPGLKVNVATCFITDNDELKQCKTLHYRDDEICWSEQTWETTKLDPAYQKWLCEQRRALFRLCTTVPCRHPAVQFLRRRKWKIPEEGEVRLFAFVNDPEAIEDFTTVVQSLANSGDATANLIARVALDDYINCEMQAAANSPRKQQDATCYAYATATVFHLVMKRIQGREGGVPAFTDLYNEFVNEFGTSSANTETVIKTFATKYRLKYRQLNVKSDCEAGDRRDANRDGEYTTGCEARQALNGGRPLIATYRLSKRQNENFNQFYKSNKQGILMKNDLGGCGNEPTDGHAVVLIHCDPVCLVFLNSRGKSFADNGLFRVADNSVLDCKYFEVYWEESALSEEEKQEFTLSGYKKAHDLARQLPYSIQQLPYQCPNCLQMSPANKFTGNFVVATCPKRNCKKTFMPAPIGFVAGL